MKKTFLVGIVVSFLCLGFFGTAFAGVIGSEAGIDLAPTQATLAAAKNYNYDQAKLAQIGTEAGVDLQPTAKTLAAAENRTYDLARLAQIATESGLNNLGRGNDFQGTLACL